MTNGNIVLAYKENSAGQTFEYVIDDVDIEILKGLAYDAHTDIMQQLTEFYDGITIFDLDPDNPEEHQIGKWILTEKVPGRSPDVTPWTCTACRYRQVGKSLI